jgi:hypothetical protein
MQSPELFLCWGEGGHSFTGSTVRNTSPYVSVRSRRLGKKTLRQNKEDYVAFVKVYTDQSLQYQCIA